MNETPFAHILFATGVPGKLFDKLRAVSSAERPHLAGAEIHLSHKSKQFSIRFIDVPDLCSVILFAHLAPDGYVFDLSLSR